MLRKMRAGEQREAILEYLLGFGRMLQAIDARLQEIVDLLKERDDEPEE